jgi:hypothetical protein
MFVTLSAKNWGHAAQREVAVRWELSVWSELEVEEELPALEERLGELTPKAVARVARCPAELAGLERPAVEVEWALLPALSRWWRSLRIAER